MIPATTDADDPTSGARQPEKAGAGRPYRIVILGGGFAGVYTAKYLTRMLGSRLDVHVELLSEENYFVFQPLLPEVAAGSIEDEVVQGLSNTECGRRW